MNFRTEYNVEPFESKISYDHKLLFLGSCFAENMSSYFERFRFQVKTNPFGILYHPLAIERLIDIALDSEYNPESNSFNFNDIWSTFDAHSSLSSSTKKELIHNLKSAKIEAEQAIKTSDFVFVSLGTAWVYKHLESEKTVANCHKIPQKEFGKSLLELSVVYKALENIIIKISKVNPNAQIIFTLSPVRHLRDGFVENQRSKSTLHLAIQKVVQNYNKVNYFPSYELLLDDLRDYRFYNKDMAHPNDLALNYIWDKIKFVFFDEKTLQIMIQVEKINKRLTHRLFNPESKDSLSFKQKTVQLIHELSKQHSHIKF